MSAHEDIPEVETGTRASAGTSIPAHRTGSGLDVLRWTLLLLVLHGSTSVLLDVPLRVLCGVLLVRPELTTNPWMWILITASSWTVNASNWTWIDNHQYLISYWCLACTLACRPGMGEARSTAILRWNAHLLIALTFLLATGWKLGGGEFYFDGSFLYYTALTDSRLETISIHLGGLDPAILNQTRQVQSALKDFPVVDAAISLPDSSRLAMVAVLMSWWTLFIEGAIALAFLLRWRIRHLLLIAFLASTYVLLPVLGFGYVLAIMGLATCSVSEKRTRIAYLAVFLLFQVSRLPWESFLPSAEASTSWLYQVAINVTSR